MRILATQLSSYLEKKPLNYLYLLIGNDVFQHKEALDLLRAKWKLQGYTEREYFDLAHSVDWESFEKQLHQHSLFSTKRLLDCRLKGGKLSLAAEHALRTLLQHPPTDTIVFMDATAVDKSIQKSSLFSELEKNALCVEVRPLSKNEFTRWIQQRFKEAHINVTEATLHAVQHYTEGNLLAAAQFIEKCALYKLSPDTKSSTEHTNSFQNLSLEEVTDLLNEETQFSVFDLSNHLLTAPLERTIKIFLSLKREGVEPLFVLWGILRQLRSLKPQLKSKGLKTFSKLMSMAREADEVLKGQRIGNGWEILLNLCIFTKKTFDSSINARGLH